MKSTLGVVWTLTVPNFGEWEGVIGNGRTAISALFTGRCVDIIKNNQNKINLILELFSIFLLKVKISCLMLSGGIADKRLSSSSH